MFSQIIVLILRLGCGALLARLLSPEEFGLFAMVSTVIGILTVFGDMGISSAIVQQQDIDQRQMSTLFWLNMALGLILTILTAGFGPALAWFYHEERLIPITLALGIGFFIAGLGVQHSALLRRQMRLATISVIGIVSSTISLLVGILLAWLDFGCWSLVWMQLAGGVVSSVAAWIACGWRPGMPARRAGIRSIVAFGGNLTMFSVLNYFVRNLDNVLIGWRWGAEPLGQYGKAYGLMMFPLSQINVPISNVAVSALSRLQNDPVRYKHYYLTGVTMIAYITMPLTVAMFVFSEEIVGLLLGPQWSQAERVFKILTIAAFLQPLSNTTGWLFTSLNRANEMARWGLISTPYFIASFFIGLPWGPEGVALAYAVACWLIMYPCFSIAVRGTPVFITDILATTYRPLCLAALAGVAMYVCRLVLASHGIVWTLVASTAAVATVVLSMGLIWHSVRIDLEKILGVARMARG